MIIVHSGAGENRIVRKGGGVVAEYAGVEYQPPVRANELLAALDLIEIVGLYESPLMALMVKETLRPKLAELGYSL